MQNVSVPTKIPKKTAVVMGASIAGLFAARILKDYFDKVIVIDKDTLHTLPLIRKHVPQANHVHIFLAKGQQITNQLFPGFGKQLKAENSPVIKFGSSTGWLTRAGWVKEFSPTIDIFSCSRAFLEWKLRYLLKSTHIEFQDNAEVLGFVHSGASITGLKIKLQRESKEKVIQADFFVDATGRSSITPKWLNQIGFAEPKETVINAYVGYASRIYERIENIGGKWNAIYIQPAPPEDLKGGGIVPIEGGKSIVTLIGMGKNYPPTNEKKWVDYAKTLRNPIFYQAIKKSKPLSKVFSYQNIPNRMRHYENIKLPKNLVILGDSACAFNPVYGEGMTAAALGAITLENWLNSDYGKPNTFQKTLAKVNAPLWKMAIIEDMRCNETVGKSKVIHTKLLQLYMNNVFSAATRNSHVARTLTEVLHLLRPQELLINPQTISKTFLSNLTKHRGEVN
ncbi:MAG: FAD-dependent monooxygenase [Candidatus Micrarchaeota archaeon]|nr:FAD-dependent monooxygenase [Candidatus Micrarchaeota archaeon]